MPDLPISEQLKFSKEFAEKIMSPAPMFVVPNTGPKEVDRHWDWKARDNLDIITPVKEATYHGHTASMIIVDEFADFRGDSWKADLLNDWKSKSVEYSKAALEGVFTTASKSPADLVLTTDKIRDAAKLLEGDIMGRSKTLGESKRKLPKKKKLRADPRKAKYNGRMFGNILLSTTEQITNNTTLNDALFTDGVGDTTVEELIAPLINEFIHVHGKEWQVTGPMNLAAQSVETDKWKSVSALGGETLIFHSAVIGSRDGVCIKWATSEIVGMDEEMMVDTTIKAFGDKLVPNQPDGNPANRKSLIDLLLDFSGEEDVVTAAEKAKERVRVAIAAQLKDDIERKSEAYGDTYGAWA